MLPLCLAVWLLFFLVSFTVFEVLLIVFLRSSVSHRVRFVYFGGLRGAVQSSFKHFLSDNRVSLSLTYPGTHFY